MPRLLTLTTDFGLTDWFVGVMKGVVLGRVPATRIVDITHGVDPGDIRGGAFALAAACRYFPGGTVHLAVVDPGVGGEREGLAVKTKRFYFVGPDNGVLSYALKDETVESVRVLRNERIFLPSVSRTFHGRDVFAPVAAYLCGEGVFEDLGPETRNWIELDWPEPGFEGPGRWRGEVIHLDRYGNAITNLPNALLEGRTKLEESYVTLENGRKVPVGKFYAAVTPGEAVAVAGSSGFVEIAINKGRAGDSLNLTPATPIHLTTQTPE